MQTPYLAKPDWNNADQVYEHIGYMLSSNFERDIHHLYDDLTADIRTGDLFIGFNVENNNLARYELDFEEKRVRKKVEKLTKRPQVGVKGEKQNDPTGTVSSGSV